jgi:hypothetical protein
MVVLNQARGLGSLAFLAAQTSLQTQAWQAVPAQLMVPSGVVPLGSNVTVTMQAPGLDLTTARITWEANACGSAQATQIPAFGQSFTITPTINGPWWVEAEAQFSDGRRVFASNSFAVNAPNIVWVEDSLPGGAVPGSDGGDSWNWQSSNPSPYSGVLDQHSTSAAGEHQVYFQNATATLSIETNAVLYAWIYLNPSAPPSAAMLQWCDQSGSWEHRAYWGANLLTFGVDGTASRTNMGALPAAGQWAQLTVPVGLVNLAGNTLNGLAFTLYGGQADWDCAGVLNPMTVGANTNSSITVNATTSVASRLSMAPGTFTLSRTGDTSEALNVSYSLGGSAVAGTDYQVSASTISFAAGSSSASVAVTPMVSSNIVGPQSIVLSLSAGAGYSVGAPGTATILLAGNNVPLASVQMSNGSPTFTWASAVNATYRVLYKNNLTNPAWLAASPNMTALAATTTWTDTNNANTTQRFYVLMQAN